MKEDKNRYTKLRLSNINVPLDYDSLKLRKISAKTLNLPLSQVVDAEISKRSIDARKKDKIHFVCSIDVLVKDTIPNLKKFSLTPKKSEYKAVKCKKMSTRPLVVGSGPAGLFAALILAQSGARPILIERGYDVERRTKTIKAFWSGMGFDEKCNVQFGEGGAGTFSDGKLTTGIKSTLIQKVLDEFVKAGAPREILYLAKPHIGTDNLKIIVKNLRKKVESLGGEVHFNSKLTGIICNDGKVNLAQIESEDGLYKVETDNIILAIGHSARDTFKMLYESGVHMTSKPFSVGARIEHLQESINKAQYGKFYNNTRLGAADYKLSTHLKNGRGVYTFCMCPGGKVVASSSEKGMVVTNGMSEFARNEINANSALLVGINPDDFGSDHPLAGIEFQRNLEKKAFKLGGENYNAPVQRVEDFLRNKASIKLGDIVPSYKPGFSLCNISDCLPNTVVESMRQGIIEMDKRLKGFAYPDALLTAVETRSSSPVRIVRKENLESVNISGLYPCGEGAGYAGGIVSAAVDGIKCAEATLKKYAD